ncbi:MAG TPA: glycosyltransferase family 2 protein [Terriglobia bacterium]|nr:glycosyltransferase family 2 protein [Terriglobia bacterium]
MNWPRISIVTPSYNQVGFIERTIQSVLDQDYPNLEYIIIDGGSTDGAVDVIRRYEKHLAYWVSEKDNGAADAIGKGFAKAAGEIFAYLNSDDLYLPGALRAVAETMQDPSVDVAYGNTYWIDHRDALIAEQRQTPFMAMGYLYGGSTLQQQSTFWRSDLYRKCGGMDATFGFAFDTDLFFRFVSSKARFRFVNKFLASFRIHPASKSSNDEVICRRDLKRLREKHLPFPYNSFRGSCVRTLSRLHRTLWYARQGDLAWLLGRIPDRIRAWNAPGIVGPRGRRV